MTRKMWPVITSKLFVALTAALIALPSLAARISADEAGVVRIEGLIQEGDAERLATVLGKMVSVGGFQVDSTGGNVLEAMRMASLVEGSRSAVIVRKGGVCASACFFLFISAQERIATGYEGKDGKNPSASMLSRGSYVGVHRPYLGSRSEVRDSSVTKQEKLMKDVRSYLAGKNTPQNLIDEMMARSSNQVYWLTDKDIETIGPFSPGVEEIYIKECGFNKRGYFHSWSRERIREFDTCAIKVWKREFLEPQMNFLIRLEIGRRPWDLK